MFFKVCSLSQYYLIFDLSDSIEHILRYRFLLLSSIDSISCRNFLSSSERRYFLYGRDTLDRSCFSGRSRMEPSCRRSHRISKSCLLRPRRRESYRRCIERVLIPLRFGRAFSSSERESGWKARSDEFSVVSARFLFGSDTVSPPHFGLARVDRYSTRLHFHYNY